MGHKKMTRAEFIGAWKGVVIITLATIAGGHVLTTGMLFVIGFKDAALHYTLATLFPLILAPAAALPLLVMAGRLRLIKDELENLLRLDTLTELPNRRAFFEQAEVVFKRERAIRLMMIDVDRFKQVNDNYGHDFGDRVLRSVAQSIQRIVAQTPGTGAKFAARIGGEEFAVLIEDLTPEAADRLADYLVEQIARLPVQGDGQLVSVTVSVGVAHRRTGNTPGTVLRVADNACYRAKRLGRNQWCDAAAIERPLPALTAA